MQPRPLSSNDALTSIEDVPGRVSPSNISLHPNTDSASDNETSERPVREKLKKASIASVPKDSLLYSRPGIAADADNQFEHVNSSIKSEHTSSLLKAFEASANGYRARVEQNRPHDNLATGEGCETYVDDTEAETNHGPTRKKSQDFHYNNLKARSLLKTTRELGGPKYDGLSPDLDAAINASQTFVTSIDSQNLPLSRRDSHDLEMGSALFGPRKKRSRDQLDTEIDREQKIVATEEAKAHRRSEEQERDTLETTAATDAEIQRFTEPISPQSEGRGSKTFSSSNTPGVSIGLNFLWGVALYLLGCRFLIPVMLLLLQLMFMH